MALLVRFDFWAAVAAWAAFAGFATTYIRVSSRLVNHVNEHYPDLWLYLGWSTDPVLGINRARRLRRMILFGLPSDKRPADPIFEELLRSTRWIAFGCVSFLTMALLALAAFDVAPS